MAGDREYTSLEMLADYECPERGPMADLDITEDEALLVFGGDENGAMRCPNHWCDEELEQTPEATMDFLVMVSEKVADSGQ